MVEIFHYVTENGENVFETWLSSFKDDAVAARIAARIARLAGGNYGDCKPIHQGVWELKIDIGARLPRLLRKDRQELRAATGRRRQEHADRRHRTCRLELARLQAKDEKNMTRMAKVSHDEVMIRKLRSNPKFAAEYLKAALDDTNDPKVLLVALRHLAEAHGVAKIAKAAGIERESLYRALSPRGNPRLSTLVAVTKAMGISLSVKAA